MLAVHDQTREAKAFGAITQGEVWFFTSARGTFR